MRAAEVGVGQRIEGADEVIERHARLRLAQGIAIEIFAGELGRQIRAEIAVDEFRSEQVVGVPPEGLAVGIVDGGFQRAGGDELRQPRHRLRHLPHAATCAAGGAWDSAGQHVGDFQRMAEIAVVGRGGDELPPEVDHDGDGFLCGDIPAGPGPDAAHGHRAPPCAAAAVAGFDLDLHVQQNHVGHHATAEFHGGTIVQMLNAVVRLAEADIG